MTKLTQEMFDTRIKDFYFGRESGYTIFFENYIVEDINDKVNGLLIYDYKIVFKNCRIESFRASHGGVSFVYCEIVDYEKIFDTKDCHFEKCFFIKPVPLVCPEEGEFEAYKVCVYRETLIGYPCIVKLLIPADAKRSSAFTNKCRCSKAKVLGIFDLDGTQLAITQARSININNIREVYTVGEWVYPDSFDDNRYDECSHGIHFFMTFKEAVDYFA